MRERGGVGGGGWGGGRRWEKNERLGGWMGVGVGEGEEGRLGGGGGSQRSEAADQLLGDGVA